MEILYIIRKAIILIYGQIKNLEQEVCGFSPLIRKGLEYLKNTDIANMASGKHVIDGDILYAVVVDHVPESKTVQRAEPHKDYLDVQYVHSGEEIIGCSFLSAKNEVLEDLSLERDVIFYKTTFEEVDLTLTAGSYAIVFPDDVHRPGCSTGNSTKVRKVILKIKLSAMK